MSPLTEKQLHLLAFLVALHDQETNGFDVLHTQSGRTLYFELAKTMLDDQTRQAIGLKQRLGRLSERTIRNRIRSFEEMGLLKVHSRSADGRTRELVATEKFSQELKLHLNNCGVILEKHFYVIDKHKQER
jgi:DNA-binding MarR family transcriptional regulator